MCKKSHLLVSRCTNAATNVKGISMANDFVNSFEESETVEQLFINTIVNIIF